MVEMVVVPTPTCVATKRNAKLRYRTFLPPVDTSFDKKIDSRSAEKCQIDRIKLQKTFVH